MNECAFHRNLGRIVAMLVALLVLNLAVCGLALWFLLGPYPSIESRLAAIESGGFHMSEQDRAIALALIEEAKRLRGEQ